MFPSRRLLVPYHGETLKMRRMSESKILCGL
jgi:hypothetical protein